MSTAATNGPRGAKELGRRLRELRQARRLSLREVAERTQMSPSFISLLEKGDTDVAFGRLQRLLVGIEATLADAMSETGAAPGRRRDSLIDHERWSASGLSVIVLTPPNGDLTADLVRVDREFDMVWRSCPADMWLYVLAGQLHAKYADGETVTLDPEASLLILAGRTFKILHTGGTESRFLRVTTRLRR